MPQALQIYKAGRGGGNQPSDIQWQDTKAHIKRLKDLYVSMGRAPKGTDEEFARQMRDEQRNLVLVTPERLYGSLRSGA